MPILTVLIFPKHRHFYKQDMHFAGGHFFFFFIFNIKLIIRTLDIDQVVCCKGCFYRIPFTKNNIIAYISFSTAIPFYAFVEMHVGEGEKAAVLF